MFRCIICKSVSIGLICNGCAKIYLKPNLYKRVLPNSLEVYSFYSYSDIEFLLKTKHKFIGYFIYSTLAKNSFKEFGLNFEYKKELTAIAIDDKPKYGYSHTAILAKHLRTRYIKPRYGSLRAKNSVSYSAKPLQYRLEHPRDFELRYELDGDIILVDDIVTTGTTLSEAKALLEKSGVNVLFALTLADARL